MKHLIPILILIASCHKPDDPPVIVVPVPKVSQWTIGSDTVKPTTIRASGSVFYAEVGTSQLYFAFKPASNALPAPGSYPVTSDAYPYQDGTVYVRVRHKGLEYFSTGTEGARLALSNDSGKVSVSLPAVWVKRWQINDSVQVRCYLKEK